MCTRILLPTTFCTLSKFTTPLKILARILITVYCLPMHKKVLEKCSNFVKMLLEGTRFPRDNFDGFYQI